MDSKMGIKKILVTGSAGLVGTHIHFIDPVSEKKSVWHIGYQDVIAYGKLIQTGEIFNERTIVVAGPVARNPRLVKTITGACLSELVAGETLEVMSRIRYRQPLEKVMLHQKEDGLYIIFENDQRGIAPGQFVAWYIEDELLGSGVIS